MQFGYAKEMAEGVAGEQVREAVVTVPGWFGQSERAAVLDALELAGLRSIGLVNDGTAGTPSWLLPLSPSLVARRDTELTPSPSCACVNAQRQSTTP